MIQALVNHLWQSTLCVGLAALLARRLRHHQARVRYWLWIAASLKFLFPFALLTELGRALVPTPVASTLAQSLQLPVALVAQSLTVPVIRATPTPVVHVISWQAVLIAVWATGVFWAVGCWSLGWLRMHRLSKASFLLPIDAPIPVRSSPGLMEPGLFGIFRPVLLLPKGLVEQFSAIEIQSILAHELCHWRRRDNLTYGIHLLSCTFFWFYPLLWWLGSRLLTERELACDEAVLAAGHEPEAYGESILKVCRYYLTAPVVATSGVSGTELHRRIERIMGLHTASALYPGQKALLIGAASIVMGTPVLLGACSSVPAPTATANVTSNAADPRARLLFEQTRPQKEVPFEPQAFDKFSGYYQSELNAQAYFHFWRDGDRYFSQITGQRPVEIFPKGPSEFFTTIVAAQLSFDIARGGVVTGLALHQNGLVMPWRRASQQGFESAELALRQRIHGNTPSPGTEASVRRWIDAESRGTPNYDDMTPFLAAAAREQQPDHARVFQRLGAFQSLAFERVGPNGLDVYDAKFTNGAIEVSIAPLTPDGKVAGRSWRVLP